MKIVRLLILTCISVFFGAASVFAADTCSKDAKFCNSKELCKRAIYYSNGANAWKVAGKHVAEAKLRGLSCGVKGAATSKSDTSCYGDVSTCTTTEICYSAIRMTSSGDIWDQRSFVARHVAEAKRRGLSCGVEGADGQPDNNVLEALREQLAKTNAELTAAKEREADLNARLTVAVLEVSSSQPDTAALDALREQLDRAKAELAKTKQKLAKGKNRETDLEARLNTAMWDHNKISTVKTSEHTAELATLTEQYETEISNASSANENLQAELSALETDASEAQSKVTELTNQLVESKANAAAIFQEKLKAKKQISQAESAALAAEQELAKFKIANDQTDLKQQLAAALAENEELKANGSDTVDVVEDTTQTVDPAKNVLVDIASLTRDEQKELQTALKEFGVYDDAIDGIMGKGSKRAIQSWQEARGYDSSGELTVGQSDELLLGEEVLTSVEVLAAVEATKPEAGQSITSVMIRIARPTFDVFNCAFNLEFTNSETGGSFDVVMFAEDGSGKFTATAKDIQKALVKNGLTSDDNEWSKLTVKATKYDDPNVGCEPIVQRSYAIKDEGPENTFKIDGDGQLTMTGLPLASTNTSGTEEVADQVFSQSVTSVIAQITNPTFDVAKCTFNLEFTNSASGKSFNVKMDPQGDTNGRFTATTNDIEDGLADAGLTAEDNDWSQLTVRVKKFDYPFVTCQPAKQSSYLISTDGAEDTFYVDRNGQLSITGLPLIPTEEAITLFGVNFDMGKAEMEEVLAGRFKCTWGETVKKNYNQDTYPELWAQKNSRVQLDLSDWNGHDLAHHLFHYDINKVLQSYRACNSAVGGTVISFWTNMFGDVSDIKFECSSYKGCTFKKDALFTQLSQSITLQGEPHIYKNQICGSGKLGEIICATDNAALMKRSKFRKKVINFESPANNEAVTLFGVNFDLDKAETKNVLANRFNCTWEASETNSGNIIKVETCLVARGKVVKIRNNGLGEIESLEFDCSTYQGCAFSGNQKWEYLPQSQSLTPLEVNTVPIAETAWLMIGDGYSTRSNSFQFRDKIRAEFSNKTQVLGLTNQKHSTLVAIGPFKDWRKANTFHQKNTHYLKPPLFREISDFPWNKDFVDRLVSNVPSETFKTGSCIFGDVADSTCYRGSSAMKCGTAALGEVVCVRDDSVSLYRERFRNQVVKFN